MACLQRERCGFDATRVDLDAERATEGFERGALQPARHGLRAEDATDLAVPE
jgi:hypothetical protein